jgi:superfamily II DNA or RNA helicase
MINSHKNLTKQGYLICKKDYDIKQLTSIKKELTVKPQVLQAYQNMVKVEEFEIFQESPNYLFVPRFYGIEKFGQPDKTKLPDGDPIDSKVTFNILPHQKTAYEKTLTQLRTYGGGVLSLPCGYGKTFLGLKISSDLGVKTLIIVNKECLIDQWIESIDKFTNGKARIGRIQQSTIDVENKDYVVGMLHSVCKKTYDDSVFSGFGFTIVDEVHHIASEMFSKALPKITSKFMLGLSATPNRKDGLSHVFHKYLGPLFHSEKRQGSNKILVKRLKLTSPTSHYETLFMSNGIKNTGAMITNLSKYFARTHLIIETIRVLMKQDRKILLLSGRREHLEDIYTELSKSNIKTIHGKAVTFGYYRGNQGDNKKTHKKILTESAKCDVVLGTYSIASEGLDIPDLNTEIMATPSADIEQSVGRILRKFHTKVNPIVIDLVDQCGNFPKQSTTRAAFYKEENYEIHDLKIPLGHSPQELDPFIPSLAEHISNSEFKTPCTTTNANVGDSKGTGLTSGTCIL